METVQKCKQCKREFQAKRKRDFCCENCRIAKHKGIKSKWQRIIETLEDVQTAKRLGYTITKNSDGA